MNLEKWKKLSFLEQMGNIGSEFSRTCRWKKDGDFDNWQKSLERAIELLDLTVEANREYPQRLLELLYLREVLSNKLSREKVYNVSSKKLQDYFLFFALASKK